MDKMDKRALVLTLVDALRASGSWCGETHIQKSCYVLQTLFQFPTDFNFILYKHGPFSFDLQEYIGELWSDELLAPVPTEFPYGTSLSVTGRGKEISALRPGVVEKQAKKLKTVAERIGKKRVSDLEKIATAIYVTQEIGPKSVKDRAARIRHYKKHISQADAESAVEEADKLSATV